jgi:hypothetical protein
MRKKTIFILAFIILLIALPMASAVKAKIGNSRMVLRPEVGETLEKYIRVLNDNDEKVTIELSASGDLADNVIIEENTFVLEPFAEKNAFFTIRADKLGRTETRIHVAFKPDEGNGAGLASVITVIPEGDAVNLNEEDETQLLSAENDDNNNQDSGVTFNPSPANARPLNDDNSFLSKISPSTFLLFTTASLTIVIIILFAYYYFNSPKTKFEKRLTKTRE